MQLLSVQPAQALAERTATDRFIEEVRSVAPNSAGRSVVEWGIGSVVVTSFQQAVGLSFTIIFIILLCYFRDWKLSILVFIPIILTIISSFAVCVLLKINLNMANILMVPLIIGLGLDSGIHIVHRHRVAPASQLDAATGKAVIISGLTTIATFCSLALSPHQGAASIGLLLSVAIGLLLVISLVLLPILLRRFSPRDDQIG
jgi:predicted RND superfamily exporter protein